MSTEATPLTAEDWLRDIAANGYIMGVWLRDGGVGDLDPEDIATVLATLDRERAEHAALREKARAVLAAWRRVDHVAYSILEDGMDEDDLLAAGLTLDEPMDALRAALR